MKNRLIFFLLLICCASLLILTSCDESEPLPEGVSSLPDVGTESFVNSETGEIEWPAELLPNNFPKAKYEEIYSVERVDNEVIIVLFAKKDKYALIMPEYDFVCSLYDVGYVHFHDVVNELQYEINREGIMVTTFESDDYESHLTAINEESPTGYTYEIRVKQTDIRVPESMYWDYPDINTDLGLEKITFEEWPYEYLPEEFPCAEGVEGISVVEMYQAENGVYITIEGSWEDVAKYEHLIFTSGFYSRAKQPHVTENGDYFYYDPAYGNIDLDTMLVKTKYLVCKFNEYVNTDK